MRGGAAFEAVRAYAARTHDPILIDLRRRPMLYDYPTDPVFVAHHDTAPILAVERTVADLPGITSVELSPASPFDNLTVDDEVTPDHSGLSIQLDDPKPTSKALRVVNPLAPVELPCEVGSTAPLCDRSAAIADNIKKFGTDDEDGLLALCGTTAQELAAQSDGLHPAVLRLIDIAVRGAQKHGKWVGVCGALGGDPLAVPILVGLGVTELSVDPVSVPGIKARVRRLDYQLCRQRAQDLLALDSAQAVRAASREVWPLD